MHANELLALPVGSAITWKKLQLDGHVIAHGPTSLTIQWSDGTDSTVSTDDFYIEEIASGIELLAATPIETPILLYR